MRVLAPIEAAATVTTTAHSGVLKGSANDGRAVPGTDYARANGPTSITVGYRQPTNPSPGDIWIDTN